MFTPHIISFLVLLFLILLYFSPLKSTKIIIFTLVFLESLAVSYFFTDNNPGIGKFPISAILPITLLSLFLLIKESRSFLEKNEVKDLPIIFSTLSNYLFYLGLFLILITPVLEIFIFDATFSPNSVSLIILGIYLTLFDKIPEKYNEPKYMVLLFCLCFCTLFPFYTVSQQLFYDSLGSSLDSSNRNIVVHWALGRPLVNLLTIFGYEVWSIGDTVYYIDLEANKVSSVSISEGCSGINSVLIFISAMFSYVIVRYERFDTIPITLLLSGITVSYIANLFRMSIIILAGHYYGSSALDWTHANIGWLIFTIWMFLFWKIIDGALSGANFRKVSS